MKLLDGKKYKDEIILQLMEKYKQCPTEKRVAIISVGDDYASKVYCNMKKKTAEKIGFNCDVIHFNDIEQESLKYIIRKLAEDEKYIGIMVQHPLPKYLNEQEVVNLIPREKDIDGMSSQTLGDIMCGNNIHAPATAVGIIDLMKRYGISIEGKKALVIGRSTIVGKPLALLLTNENATVTLAHSKTSNLADIIKDYDIVVGAIGKPEYLKSEWFREGQVVIDAGYNEGNVGDIDHNVANKAYAYTPVPGGVGPMTIATLMRNIDKAVELQK